jgi:hypothetical protein
VEFEQYKRAVGAAAKKLKRNHMCPNANALYELWLAKTPVDTVVAEHCTVEAQRRRHGLPEVKGDS